jgi:iron complex outermembrane recepter protein
MKFSVYPAVLVLACGLLVAAPALPAPAAAAGLASAADLKQLSIEELMQIDVTSVSRRSERLSQAAAAVTVITGEELRRSGVTSLAEALRLADSLHVARTTQGTWAISARGFNITTANKLLVLIDGRTVYTPLFAGTFWDVQDTLLEDVERIEVIRGPGATLWGANAVNGIINIITRKAEDTQGGLVTAGGGAPEQRGFGGVRYGGKLGGPGSTAGFYRVYGKSFDRGPLELADGGSARDPMQMGQGGFRSEWKTAAADSFTLQGDAYTGRLGEAIRDDTELDGGNLLGRWAHKTSERSDLELQVYWDRTHRRVPDAFEEHRDTWDLDLQNHLHPSARHDVVWGAGFRRTRDRVGNSAVVAFLPDRRTQDLYSLFAQDEIALAGERVHLTVGTKVEHNDASGFEVQPNLRLAWTPDGRRTFWGAVSRAVRTPTRLDEDIRFLAGPVVILRGDPDFQSEKLIAYEAGWRQQLSAASSVDAAAFYNVYDDLRSQAPSTPGKPFPIVLANNLRAETWGVEMRSNFQVASWCRWQAGYAFFDKHLHLKPGTRDSLGGREEGNDPQHRLSLRSLIDLPGRVELDAWLRWVDRLPFPEVASYTELDLHLGWHPSRSVELSLVGQNLLHGSHPEFGAGPAREEVQRGYYGKIAWSF